MDKYRGSAEKKLKGTHPDVIARKALQDAEFSKRDREYFFNEAYGDILVDFFIEWLGTESHETKKREFIYSCALGLGDVKARLIRYETLGGNIPYLNEDNNETD